MPRKSYSYAYDINHILIKKEYQNISSHKIVFSFAKVDFSYNHIIKSVKIMHLYTLIFDYYKMIQSKLKNNIEFNNNKFRIFDK